MSSASDFGRTNNLNMLSRASTSKIHPSMPHNTASVKHIDEKHFDDDDLHATDWEGRTAIHVASSIGNNESLKLLISRGADIHET